MSVGNKTYQFIKRPLILVLLVVGILFIFQRIHLLPSFADLFKKKPLLIENTPLVITEIKNIAELQTAQLYTELVIDSTVVTKLDVANTTLKTMGIPSIPFLPQKKLVLIIKGKVIAGINLQKIHSKSIYTEDDSISIRLPEAEILDVITNPSDIETFKEKGEWQNAEITAVKNQARKKLRAEAYRQNLLQQADDRAENSIRQFLETIGFKKIHITRP